MLEDRDT